VRDTSVRGAPDISALASRSTNSASLLVFNYHDDDLPAADAQIGLTIDGLPNGGRRSRHFRVDATHSNSTSGGRRWAHRSRRHASSTPSWRRRASSEVLAPSKSSSSQRRIARKRSLLHDMGIALVHPHLVSPPCAAVRDAAPCTSAVE
jgi:hypothetical protein